MAGSLLLRGMLIGIVAGFIAFIFAYQFGEPQVDLAIAFEEQAGGHSHGAVDAEHTHGTTAPDAEAGPVSRATQASWGLGTALVIFGAALGGIFSLVFAYAHGRLGTLSARGTSAVLALAGFVAVVVVPQLKYPANPPAVGSDDTISLRTAMFFLMLALSVAAMTAAFVLARRLWVSHGAWNGVIAAVAAYVAAMAVVSLILPSFHEMPEGFLPQVLWNFRVSTIGIHAILWAVIGLGFGVLAEHRLDHPARTRFAHY